MGLGNVICKIGERTFDDQTSRVRLHFRVLRQSVDGVRRSFNAKASPVKKKLNFFFYIDSPAVVF